MIPCVLFIPLCQITTWNHNELRIALRSWEMYGPPIDTLLIIGYKPKWIGNCHHIEYNDRYSKTQNIFSKVKIAADHYDCFIFGNDDHFLLQPMNELPYYHAGPIREFKGGGETFMRYVNNTYRLFPNGLYYDVHTPMIVDSAVMAGLEYQRDTLFKSCYGNTAGVDGELFKDCKMSGHIRLDEVQRYISGRPFLSIGEYIPYDLKKWLWEKYPQKSKWELD